MSNILAKGKVSFHPMIGMFMYHLVEVKRTACGGLIGKNFLNFVYNVVAKFRNLKNLSFVICTFN
jgi:hypothetical protein